VINFIIFVLIFIFLSNSICFFVIFKISILFYFTSKIFGFSLAVRLFHQKSIQII